MYCRTYIVRNICFLFFAIWLALLVNFLLNQMFLLCQHETQLIEDGLALPGFGSIPKLASSDEDFIDSDDMPNGFAYSRPATARLPGSDSMMTATAGRAKREFRRRPLAHGWSQKRVITYSFSLLSCAYTNYVASGMAA